MKIGIASDHQGYRMKKCIIKYLEKEGYNIKDYGPYDNSMTDYTKYAFLIGEKVREQEIDYGILVCGTGIGMSIACNKVPTVRCAKVDSISDAKLTRKDNDANVIALSKRMPKYKVKDILDVFFNTPFEENERYIRRKKQILDYEKGKYDDEC